MNIRFIIEPDMDCDYYREVYTAEITTEDGQTFTVNATEDEVSFAEFKSDIFEDLFMSLAETAGLEVIVDLEDYASVDIEDFLEADAILEAEDIEDYNPDASGC